MRKGSIFETSVVASLLLSSTVVACSAFVVTPSTTAVSTTLLHETASVAADVGTTKSSKSPLFEYLKFDGAPKFDVLAKTQRYVESQTQEGETDESWYDKDYVLRGPVIGPINRKDLNASQKGLDLRVGFPDIKIDTFGYTIDPENPYRCFYFQRWRAVHSADMDIYGDIFPATGNEAETPVTVFSVVWTPEEKIIYEQVGAVVDRFEGNTQGKAAVFGLLHTAGLKLEANPGNKVFQFIQRLGHFLGGRGRSWSKEEELPAWWKSTSRGADGTDQW